MLKHLSVLIWLVCQFLRVICVCASVCMYVCMYVYVCACLCLCVFICVCDFCLHILLKFTNLNGLPVSCSCHTAAVFIKVKLYRGLCTSIPFADFEKCNSFASLCCWLGNAFILKVCQLSFQKLLKAWWS